MDVWVYGFIGVSVYGYWCIGVGDVTPLPCTSSASPAHDTTAHKRKEANQTDRTLNSTSFLCSSGRTPVSSRACTSCVEACIQNSETRLGQSMSNQSTDP